MSDAIASVLVCPNEHRYPLNPGKRWRRTCPTCAAPLPCRVTDCPDAILARGLCTLHYGRDQTHGDPTLTLLIRGDDWARFMSHVEFEDDSDCWLWTACVDDKGYGVFNHRVDGSQVQVRAHRWAWIYKNGPVPGDLPLDHFKCDRPLCANPAHVRPATQRENVLRSDGPAAWNLAKTHCPQNHPYDDENTYVNPKTGQRACRICMRASLRRSRARARARWAELERQYGSPKRR